MSFPIPSRYIYAGLCGLLLASTVGTACGPDFPNAYLANSLDEVTTLPSLDFESELARIFPRDPKPGPTAEEYRKAEIDEVRGALADTGLPAVAIDAVVANYRRDQPPAQLPPEFHLYARGAKAWHAGDPASAIAVWRELLALPEKERHYRTVWAGYMLGRAWCDTDPAAAREASRAARAAAAHGFADSQQLAVASLGWEARTFLRQGDYGNALKLYARQFQAGEPSATASLQFSLRRAFRGETDREDCASDETSPPAPPARAEGAASFRELSDLAADPQLRGLVTAWFVSRGGPHAPWSQEDVAQFNRWIGALGQSRDLAPAEADRWCWAAYQNGLWDEAAKLAARAPADAPAAEWVRAMLLLRQGFLDEAAQHLAHAAQAFPADRTAAPLLPQPEFDAYGANTDAPVDRLAGVRGTLALRREQFAEALRLFLDAGHWTDAAYVAERILTLDELTALVRTAYPAVPVRPASASPWSRSGEPDARAAAYNIRHLLARRLAREAHFDEAREFFPEELRADYDRYVSNVRTGYDEKRALTERAAGFWTGAQVVREHGMELIGTELAPDYAIWGGSFQWPDLVELRGTDGRMRFWGDGESGTRWAKAAGPLAPTPGEYERVSHGRVPEQRFHYHYRAAELAWLGASLLPNDDIQAALMLNTAGRWLAPRDPERANLFYKTLVLRCAHTDLGREAAGKHWFAAPPESAAAP